MDDVSVRPETLAGDPFAAEREQVRQSRRTEAELVEAIAEDEARQGRPMTPTEREAFALGFFCQEYAAEVRLLARNGMLNAEDDQECVYDVRGVGLGGRRQRGRVLCL